jgi:hypothetical protein
MKKTRHDQSGVPSADFKQSGSSSPTKNKMRASSVTRGTSGPRTPAGKQRSKLNAIKHGIFSNVALLDNESRSELDSLYQGLVESYSPVGSGEELEVELLAIHYFRYKRLLIAEVAEIREGMAFSSRDPRGQSPKIVTIVVTEDGRKDQDLIRGIADPEILARCLVLLRILRKRIEEVGFDMDQNNAILTNLYGSSKFERGQQTILGSYEKWLREANRSEEERLRNQSASREGCRENFLVDLDGEIRRLERSQSVAAERSRIEQLRLSVPGSSQPDRLLRYEVNLQKNIDRTLSRLERLQRVRLGHPAPPSINLNVS